MFDLVAEVTQRMTVQDDDMGAWDFHGGATIILGPRGDVRYVVRKRIDQEERLNSQREFMASAMGRRLWTGEAGHLRVSGELFQLLHATRAPGSH